MSLSNEWFEYHLTTQGWVEGSEKIDFAGLKEKELPEDRVLTLHFHEHQSSSFSPMERWYDEQWRHEDEKLVSDSINTYGEMPEHYQKSNYAKR